MTRVLDCFRSRDELLHIIGFLGTKESLALLVVSKCVVQTLKTNNLFWKHIFKLRNPFVKRSYTDYKRTLASKIRNKLLLLTRRSKQCQVGLCCRIQHSIDHAECMINIEKKKIDAAERRIADQQKLMERKKYEQRLVREAIALTERDEPAKNIMAWVNERPRVRRPQWRESEIHRRKRKRALHQQELDTPGPRSESKTE